MGRIAPRRRKTTRAHRSLQRVWQRVSQRLPFGAPRQTPAEADSQPPTGGQGQGIKALLLKIWHLPDGFGWLEPLPYFHRRWVIIFGAILLLSLLWPYSPDRDERPGHLESPSAQQTDTQPVTDASDPGGQWQRYHIQPGQTLAQLFRDNSLPVNEVFAMAQVEGNDKPLSNLKAGQEVRIERDANGVIIALSVTTLDNRQVTFRRQADGGYRRQR
ncbi:TPA: Opacity-associated protein A domain protein [Serratia rubidaea]|uniref:OapA family protein n=1 Tax=Serratia rubidaea TaxID=61652 RepID=UPI0023AEB001|nr:LysM-like peptidoglycan-binding domain-containing protein [Serratia rubidaea]MDK1706376.1 LysM-like peptidoglycan-binding domain-containing protein [Serratia rubidaea]HDJ1438166.1 Opacity-associated protein A domain protein [Serratia rubidaea]HDJ1449655.1 Opacity-associated protein A domain protein [Serratia rubidaea]HDJ1459934.1 Opacity-associated protein A domain protein [Serratia rubidaea]HDJ2770642.1 Opacity-associated protein A domain protein [Serratia rubidaea]